MNEKLDNVEHRTEEHFAAERQRLRAPSGLWARVETAITQGAPRRQMRWRAFAVSGAVAAAIALTLALVIGRFEGGGPQSADQVLAGAIDALMDPESVGLTSYVGVAEFETEIKVGMLAGSDTVITMEELSPDGTPLGEPEPVTPEGEEETVLARSSVQLAFKAPSRYLLQVETIEPPVEAGEQTLFVMDGDTLWTYESRSNTYARSPVESLAMVQWYFQPGSFVGGADIARLLQGLASQPDTTATLVREETLLGRPVYVIEISPAYRGTRTGTDGASVDYSGGVVRMWLDKEFLFTLRMEMPQGPDGGTWTMRVTEIEFNGDVSDDLFRFDPPEGAIEVAGSDGIGAGGSAVGSGPGGVHLPAGFLTPAYLPAGYEAVSAGSSSDSRGQEIAAEFLLEERGGEGSIWVQERVRPDGMPDAMKRGQKTAINGNEAWLEVVGGEISLAWGEGDLVIQVLASEITEEEVFRMAESMQMEEAVGDDLGIATPVEQAVPAVPNGP